MQGTILLIKSGVSYVIYVVGIIFFYFVISFATLEMLFSAVTLPILAMRFHARYIKLITYLYSLLYEDELT
jgi:hypothetical protein